MNIKKTINFAVKYLSDADYRFLWNLGSKKNSNMPDDQYLSRLYKAKMGCALNLDNPTTFNEKLQWLKLYNRNPMYTMMADKYLVRQYIAETLGEEYLIPLLGVWDNPEDIDFDALPNQFVLKCNHNSGLGMCICKDKSKLDIEKTKEELRKGLQQDYYLLWREWPYKNVPRKIIAEKYMADDGESELKDYKLFCFNGEPNATLVCSERFSAAGLHEDFYNELWEKLPVKRPNIPTSEVSIDKPANFELMKELARKLAKDMPFVRTDFYEINGKVYFGEITFFPASGFTGFDPEHWDREFGEWIKLPENRGGGYLTVSDEFVFVFQEKTNSQKCKCDNLTDYKFFCFNGHVDCVMVCLDRSSGDTKFYFFDRYWNLLRYNIRGKNVPKNFTIPKPSNMDEMFDIAEKLSKGLPFARIDLYSVSGRTYFGEITFFPDSGFDANLLPETDLHWGKKIDISRINSEVNGNV